MEEPAKRRVLLTYFKGKVTVINQFIRTFATHKTIPKWGCQSLASPFFFPFFWKSIFDLWSKIGCTSKEKINDFILFFARFE